MDKMDRETAMNKFMLAKKRKDDMVKKIQEELKVVYEKKTGLKANYFFAM